MNYPALPQAALPPVGGSKGRICIVSHEFVGPTNNGGIGTAYTSLAEALSAAGFSVTCLYPSSKPAAAPGIEHWVASYRERGIELVELQPAPSPLVDPQPYVVCSLRVYEWFKQHTDFDVIHFPELEGSGYHTLLAKHQGLLPGHAVICVGIHSMTMWLRTAMQEWVWRIVDLELDFMERRSVELADLLVSPSQYLINWIVEHGWRLPAQSCVQPYVQPRAARRQIAPSPVHHAVKELVFFGRLETRKGLGLFCDAVSRLVKEGCQGLETVTFLGRENTIDGAMACDYLQLRVRKWPFRVQVLKDYGQPQAVAYLQGEGRLAVIPSLMENSPNTVYECLGCGIPFLTSRAGGIPELILPEDANAICFDTTPEALADRLRRALAEGVSTSRPAVDAVANEQAWVDWHCLATAQARTAANSAPVETADWPKLSVCVRSCDRPNLLSQALCSIEASDYPNLEVVLVDAGSTDPGMATLLESVRGRYGRLGWNVVRQAHSGMGAARNLAAEKASGEFLLFLDEDDRIDPIELTTLVRVARRTGADLVTCGSRLLEGTDSRSPAKPRQRQRLPLGAAAAIGVFQNCFGSASSLIRTECFRKIGGFSEDRDVKDGAWAFLAAASLRGLKLEVVPEFLHGRREPPLQLDQLSRTYSESQQAMRNYLGEVREDLREVFNFAQGYYLQAKEAPVLSDYASLTIRWRSKLEAAQALASMQARDKAVKLMVEAVQAVQHSGLPIVILEAMLQVGEALRPLDLKRATSLARLAGEYAAFSANEAHRIAAKALLQRCVGR